MTEQAAQLAHTAKYRTAVSKWPCSNTCHEINKYQNRVKINNTFYFIEQIQEIGSLTLENSQSSADCGHKTNFARVNARFFNHVYTL